MITAPSLDQSESSSSVDILGALQDLAAADTSGYTDQELLDQSRLWHQLRCLADAGQAATVAVINQRGAGSHDGAMSTKAWMRHHLRMALPTAGAYIDAAKALPGLPRFATEFAAGNLGLDHINALAWLRKKTSPEIARLADTLLLDTALTCEASEVRRLAKIIKENLQDTDDPEPGPDPDRFVRLDSTLDGVWSLAGGLTPEAGALLKTGLDALMPRPAPDDDRSYTQRMHDAFTDLIRCALDSGDLPGTGGEKPHLGVLMRLEDLNPDPAHAPGVPTAPPHVGAGLPTELSAELTALLAALGRDPRALTDALTTLQTTDPEPSGASADTSDTSPENPQTPDTGLGDTAPLDQVPDWLTDTPEDLAEPTLYIPAEWLTEPDPTPTEPTLDYDPDWATTTEPEWLPPAWLPDLDAYDIPRPRSVSEPSPPPSSRATLPSAAQAPEGRAGPDQPGTTPPPGKRSPGGQLLLPGLTPSSHGSLPTPGHGGLADWGARLTPAATQRIACHCALHRVLIDSRDVPVSAGPRTRLVTTVQRRLLVARDRGCRFPGCTMPPKWTQAHHVRFWSHGGPTELNNLVLLCSFHHHRVHDDGWTMKFDGHTLVVNRPDGTPLNAREASPPFTNTA
jgi:hypothetical protein